MKKKQYLLWFAATPLPWQVCSFFANNRRKQGKYDKITLLYFYLAWKKSAQLTRLIEYLKFRRDLGYKLPKRFVKVLSENLSFQTTTQQRLIINWLAETSNENLLTLHSVLDKNLSILKVHSQHSPSAAVIMSKYCKNVKMQLVELKNDQIFFKKKFSEYIQLHHKDVLAVGNASTSNDPNINSIVNNAKVIIRFNHYKASLGTDLCDDSNREDCKVNIWVQSSDFKVKNNNIKEENPLWVVISGPDIIFQLKNWDHIESLLQEKHKVITPPLYIWRELVHKLEAPPSSGILMLAWLKDILGGVSDINAIGFQNKALKNQPYHRLLSKHKANSRHNWDNEKLLLNEWESEGLNFL